VADDRTVAADVAAAHAALAASHAGPIPEAAVRVAARNARTARGESTDPDLLRAALASHYPGAELYLQPLAGADLEPAASVTHWPGAGVLQDPGDELVEIYDDAGDVIAVVPSWPACASEPVWAPELPDIAPRPSQGR
jgi:hypothetical protein